VDFVQVTDKKKHWTSAPHALSNAPTFKRYRLLLNHNERSDSQRNDAKQLDKDIK
jgi:hypothetical protein